MTTRWIYIGEHWEDEQKQRHGNEMVKRDEYMNSITDNELQTPETTTVQA